MNTRYLLVVALLGLGSVLLGALLIGVLAFSRGYLPAASPGTWWWASCLVVGCVAFAGLLRALTR